VIIERVAEAMTQALAANRDRVDGELIAGMQNEWDAGRMVALNDTVASGLRRKPVGKTDG
jgi:serine/threonine-protein kinase HipA